MTVGLHVCFGNLRGRPQSARRYAPILPHLRDARCDVVFLEFANRELAEVEEWARHGTSKAANRFNMFELRPADTSRVAPAGEVDGPPDSKGVRRTRTGWRKVLRPGEEA